MRCALCPGYVDPDIDPYLCPDCAEDIPGQFEIHKNNRRMLDADPDRYDHYKDTARWINNPAEMAETLALLVGKTVVCGSLARDATTGLLITLDSSWCVQGDPVVSFSLGDVEMLCLEHEDSTVSGYIYIYGL